MIAVRLLEGGVVVREAVFRGASLTIGRSPESDFALVDPSISREHARVRCDETGAAWVEDAGSRNGLRVAGLRIERVDLVPAAPLRCQLGSLELEIALSTAADTQEIAVPVPSAHGPLAMLRPIGWWALALAGIACDSLISPAFWSPWNQERLSSLAQTTVGFAMALPVAAFLLFGMLRVVHRRTHVGDALRSFAVVSWAWVAVGVVQSASAYLTTVSLHGLLNGLLASVAGAGTVAYLAATTRPGPNRRFYLAWLGAMALVIGAFMAAGHFAGRQNGTPVVDHDLLVPVAGFSGPAADLDRYIEGLRSDYAVAERAAAEERRYSAARR